MLIECFLKKIQYTTYAFIILQLWVNDEKISPCFSRKLADKLLYKLISYHFKLPIPRNFWTLSFFVKNLSWFQYKCSEQIVNLVKYLWTFSA